MEKDEKGNNVIKGFNEDKHRLKGMVQDEFVKGNVIFYEEGITLFEPTDYNDALKALRNYLDYKEEE